MDKEVVVDVYNRILAIKRNEFKLLVVRWMHLQPVTQSEVSQKKKKRVYSCINMEYRKWYLWTYLQGRNRDTDVENGYVDAAREGEVEWIESGTDKYRVPCVPQTASAKLYIIQGAQPGAVWQCRGVRWVGGRKAHEAEDLCIPIADSFCCKTETNTTL